MGKNKKNADQKFTLFIKLSRRIPNSINISEYLGKFRANNRKTIFVSDDSVREMIPTVLNVRKPRQKSSRWLLVDFETNEQAEEFKKILVEKKEIAKIKVKTQKLNIKDNSLSSDDTNDRQQYINSLTKQTFQSKSLEKYSNKLLVTNLPETVTKSELVELFPHHLSIDLKTSPKLRAIIAYSSVKEAMAARMQVRPQLLNGHKIRVILLLLEDETRKQKPSPETATKKAKREPHKFIKPLRYFENEIE
jgi:RNA recognition motif-containing protein